MITQNSTPYKIVAQFYHRFPFICSDLTVISCPLLLLSSVSHLLLLCALFYHVFYLYYILSSTSYFMHPVKTAVPQAKFHFSVTFSSQNFADFTLDNTWLSIPPDTVTPILFPGCLPSFFLPYRMKWPYHLPSFLPSLCHFSSSSFPFPYL